MIENILILTIQRSLSRFLSWYKLRSLSVENRNIHSSAWSVSECEIDSVLTQTQEVWHEESDQECVSEDTQQAVTKKLSSAAVINADWRRNQNSVSRDIIKKWASEESSDTQDAA